MTSPCCPTCGQPLPGTAAGLTPAQAKLLDFIVGYQRRHRGMSPSYREMADAMGLKSTSGIHRAMALLEEHKAISREHGGARAITVLRRAA